MPGSRWQRRLTFVKVNTPWRRLLGNRIVFRQVQGVGLYMPWSHLLPDLAKNRATYGQNLVELAAGLQQGRDPTAGPLPILDIGANLGDSAAQILARIDARVLCVEGDPYWARFLRMNLGDDPRVCIEPVLLTADDAEWSSSSPVRGQWTTHFVQDSKGGALPNVSVAALRNGHPEFDGLRLIKSDTDGFDPVLVPAAAQAWADDGPVLFFEFDPSLARLADKRDPNELWPRLEALGYTRLAVWDNTGDPLGQLDTADAMSAARSLEPRPVHLGYDFWDVAACRFDDTEAIAVFDKLVPDEFSVFGTWR